MNFKEIARGFAIASSFALLALLSDRALAVDDTASPGSFDLTSVRSKIAANDFKAAIVELRGLAEDNQEADVYNLLGFSLRKTGDFQTSLTYYNKALALQPDYKPAHEYLGELYLDMGDIASAKGQLSNLTKLCPIGCEELADLQKAIEVKTKQ
ncbi:MAG: tetratricopeptide repeat protein [Aestuariivirga sp.]